MRMPLASITPHSSQRIHTGGMKVEHTVVINVTDCQKIYSSGKARNLAMTFVAAQVC